MTHDEKDFPTLIRSRLEALGWQQKQLAYEWHRAAGKKKATSVSTYESRLSNLMTEEEDGYTFVDETDEGASRLEALACVITVPIANLRAVLDATKIRPTIVFGERTPDEQLLFFEKRADRFPTRLRVVRVTGSEGTPRERLRDTARKYRNAFVVVSGRNDGEFYAGAGVRTTEVQKVNRGYRIEQVPELSLRRPPRIADADGMPMFADPKVEAEFREIADARRPETRPRSEHEKWLARIEEADAEDTPVTFRHDWLMEKRCFTRPTPNHLVNVALERGAMKGLRTKAERRDGSAYIQTNSAWWHEDRVVGFSEARPFQEKIKPVEFHEITTFGPIVEKLAVVFAGMNPLALEPVKFDLSSEIAAFKKETGIALEFDGSEIRSVLKSWAPSKAERNAGDEILQGEDHDAPVREAIDEMLSRRFEIPINAASAIWMLSLLRDAPLLHAKSNDLGGMEAVADLGTGTILRFKIERYPSERRAPMRLWTEGIYAEHYPMLDGGDVRFTWWRTWVVAALEGTSLGAVPRRREAVARRAAEAASDDD